LANHIVLPCRCSKLVTSTKPCFFRHWFQTAVYFTRKFFQDDSGLQASSFSGFQQLATLARCRFLHSKRWLLPYP
jgi:hypothetical protein